MLSLRSQGSPKKIVTYLIIALALCSALGMYVANLTKDTYAADLSGWNAGKIIDDGVFTNANSMSASQIQAFLVSKVPVCDTWGTGGSTPTARRDYIRSKGYDTPLKCLMDYNEGGKSAAQIIHDAAQEFQINPQVLLVLLEKEQSLVTDNWPGPWQFKSATGYGCPDTNICDSQYYGLTNQVRWAARMFRAIMNASPTWYSPFSVGNNKIYYNPGPCVKTNSAGTCIERNPDACNSSIVNIQNRATQALYSYTPYQPNQSALNAVTGTGDSCGAYGNRNFYLFFTEWFGSTQVSQQSIKDTFKFERLVGTTPSIKSDQGALGTSNTTISAGSVLHNFYYDDAKGVLKHVWSDQNGWNNETLDGDETTSDGGVKANVGAYVTGYYDGSNKIKIFYQNVASGSLRVGEFNISQSKWSFSTIDGTGGQSGLSNRVGEGITAVQYNNYTQLFYYDATGGNLRHAWTDSRGWNFENLDGDKGSIGSKEANTGQTPSVAIYNGNIQLFYYDATGGNLRHAWTDSRGWNFENLDGDKATPLTNNGDIGLRPVVKVYQSDIYVFYYDSTKMLWKVALADRNGWQAADLDGSPGSLSRSPASTRGRLSVDVYGNSLQVFYQDYTNGLKHAWTDR